MPFKPRTWQSPKLVLYRLAFGILCRVALRGDHRPLVSRGHASGLFGIRYRLCRQGRRSLSLEAGPAQGAPRCASQNPVRPPASDQV